MTPSAVTRRLHDRPSPQPAAMPLSTGSPERNDRPRATRAVETRDPIYHVIAIWMAILLFALFFFVISTPP